MGAMGEYMEDGMDQFTPITHKRQHITHQENTKRKRHYGNCPIHTRGNHSAEECLVLRQLNQARQHQQNTMTTSNNLCRYCKKVSYHRGHNCQEYHQQKVVHNRAIHVKPASTCDQNILDRLLPVHLEKMDITGMYISHTAKAAITDTAQYLLVPITIQIEKVMALVDTGATTSFITPTIANTIKAVLNKDIIVNTTVSLAQHGSKATLFGLAENIHIKYNGKQRQHDFLVMELSGDAPVTIGLDLMPKLGIGVTGLAVAWEKQLPNTNEKINDVPPPNESPAGSSTQCNLFFDTVQPTINRNVQIPPRSFCTIPESVLHLDTEEGVVSHR